METKELKLNLSMTDYGYGEKNNNLQGAKDITIEEFIKNERNGKPLFLLRDWIMIKQMLLMIIHIKKDGKNTKRNKQVPNTNKKGKTPPRNM